MSGNFYYEEGYEMEVGAAAKRIIEARDAYFKAWVEWNETCLGGCMSADDEADAVKNILNTIIKKKAEEEKA